MTFRTVECRDLLIGNVWKKDAQHHPHHIRRRLTDGGCLVPRFQHEGTEASLLTQNVEEGTLTYGKIVRRAYGMRDIHAISPLL